MDSAEQWELFAKLCASGTDQTAAFAVARKIRETQTCIQCNGTGYLPQSSGYATRWRCNCPTAHKQAALDISRPPAHMRDVSIEPERKS